MGSDLSTDWPFTDPKWIKPPAKIWLSVRIRIEDETILGPISVRIRIGHPTAYTRVLIGCANGSASLPYFSAASILQRLS